MENSLAQIDLLTKQYKQQFDIPYLPTLSTAWDSSPRTLPSDGCKAVMLSRFDRLWNRF